MKKALRLLFAMPVTGLLLLIFAASIAYATFIENDLGTVSAKILVYDSIWFKVLLLIITIHLAGSIIVNQLFVRRKWTIFMFHVSFIIILAGGAVSRYMGTEGTMHIREGETMQTYISDESYVSIDVTDGQESRSISKEVKFSAHTKNRFKESITLNGQTINIESIQFIPSASRAIVEDENGGPVLAMLAIGKQNQRH